MRVVLQRVSEAWVEVDGEVVGSIGHGALVLLGVEAGDTDADAKVIADKCANIRVFDDRNGRINLSVSDIGGEFLLVSQFTLCADSRKGRRPSFVHAAPPDEANRLFDLVVGMIRNIGIRVKTGRFQAHMKVHLINDGPVTLLIDSRKRF